jgi:hypothetical protein
MTDTAWCAGCDNLLGRVPTDKAKEAIVGATDKHRVACAAAGELIAAIRYASADDNDDPDPAARLAGAATAYLEHNGVTLWEEPA